MYATLIECDPHKTLGGSCIRDLFNTANYLSQNYKININVFTNNTLKNSEKLKFPQKCKFYIIKNLKNQIRSITDTMKKNNILFVLISGHGYQTGDKNSDEIDGRDEYVRTNDGILLDDTINDIFLYRHDIKVVGVLDTCHSGSLFDLQYSWNGSSWIKAKKNIINTYSAISISACRDNQLEACDITDKYGFGGALVGHLLDNDYLKILITGNMDQIINIYKKIKKILSVFGQQPVLQKN
uniref:Caspase domain protein n=1 Tax=Mimivirus LCMiAC02 TaxID=2506609 RepID=A0A481Z2F5_9VIRU|nr:MAG: hypothetical protein LCMiAC02_05760 [Mimivirus LCMiAC02]